MSFYADGSATRVDTTLEGKYFQVLTHLVALVATIDFLRRREYYAASISSPSLIASTMYHICKAAWFCFGLALETLRLFDHINSTHAAAAVPLIVAFGESGGGLHAILYRLPLLVMTTFAVLAFPYQTKAAVIVVTFDLLVVAAEYMWVRRARIPLRNRFALRYLIPLVPCAVLALVCYAEPAFLPREISHGIWHILVYSSLWLSVRAVNNQESGDGDSVL